MRRCPRQPDWLGLKVGLAGLAGSDGRVTVQRDLEPASPGRRRVIFHCGDLGMYAGMNSPWALCPVVGQQWLARRLVTLITAAQRHTPLPVARLKAWAGAAQA